MISMAKIQIAIEEGKVRDVVGVPVDVVVEVFNYDVQEHDPKVLSIDENGKLCEIKEWRAPE
jgi:hypothetical protein